ncbi:serine/threonine protein kinase [Mycolicibacterium aromaticivorans JS19b1 = JCM 16368]|uniref:non-specific serine/threonine protein kinase n=1 Tax=Mycolicibacterium aromaticivorans JS19b1 = JCM 16368 TaxID=1440774 RepID=A0A064CT00_9MYCO|nr:protein kinase [Mycolicibacterium aromaticivorans]KDF01799.1 serine/threonine protein kinase [Mycolicibacterium aromaticivorans JS19b1 = JCM 16368]
MSVTSDPLNGVLLEDRYRVDAKIATGGMSTVYRGLDVRLDRPVALKVMDARYAGDSQFLTRFQREARAVARLKDPGLVAVYDQGLDGSHPFLVMELIEGGTLRELLRERGPMPPHAAAAVLRPLLGGLATAHRAGLVHRDVKPENVLISDDGEVKLVDFGLVRAVAEAGITSTSVILGTAAYLSPEQVSTGAADARSDVYAVGVLAYELITGATPFTGDNPLTVAYQRMDHDVPPPSAAISGVPPQFDEFIARATARDPEARFADAAEMAEDLDAIAVELALPKFRVPAPRNSAQHAAATAFHSRPTVDFHPAPQQVPAQTAPPLPPPPAVKNPTRQLIRDPQDWRPIAEDDETPELASQFAGIDIGEFIWERQRARRSLMFWTLIVLLLTGGMAAAGWALGTNLQSLIG